MQARADSRDRALGIVAERASLIAQEAPPRLGWPSAWCRQITRDGGLGNGVSEHEKLTVDPWHAPEKVLPGHLSDQIAHLAGRPADCLPRQRPDDRYCQSADQPLRRQRKTVSGWTISRLSRHCDHQRDSKIQNSRSIRRKQGRRVRLRSSTAIWWRNAIASSNSAVRVRGSFRTTGTALLVGVAMKASYRQTSETTNESAPIKF